MDAVCRLAGGVAHDFGSVLTAIRGYADRARRHLPEDGPGPANLEGVIRAADRGADLISRLLVISRPREIEPTLLELDELIAETGAMLRRVVGDDVELLIDLDANEGRVRGERSQVEQVLLNLAVNARDAMPDGGTLTIATGSVVLDEEQARSHGNVAPGDYVTLACSDDGIGMDRDTVQRIFEPFFTTKTEGTGLGLSTVYGIVKNSGGHVLVDSEPNRGTTFTVYLPLAS
jgi:signal transduction histidine kinase